MRNPAQENEDERGDVAAFWCARLSEGELGAADQREMEAWLSSSDDNVAALERAVLAWSLMDDVAAAPELVAMRAEALEQARRSGRNRWRRSFALRPAILSGLAASMAAAIVFGALWVEAQPAVYQTSVGERRLVVLEDGSRLSLDAASAVRVKYDRGRRRLWLDQGRAKFDVSKDAHRPFSVEARSQTILATGTSFSVERLGEEVRVILYEGHIAVVDNEKNARPVRDPGGRAVRIRPLEEVIVNNQGVAPAPVVHAISDPTRSLAWEAGQISLEEVPLSVAIERFNRYSEVKFVLEDPGAGSVKISGVFRAGDTEAIIEGITVVFPIVARRDGSRIVLAKNNDGV